MNRHFRKRISEEDRREILTYHATQKVISLSGIFTGLIMSFILISILEIIPFFDISPYYIHVLLFTLILSLFAGELNLMEYQLKERLNLNFRIPLVYLLFLVSITFINVKLFLNPIKEYLIGTNTALMSTEKIISNNTLIFIIFILTLSFITPIFNFWRMLYMYCLLKIGSIDYELIFDKQHFDMELKFRFLDYKRHGGPLSLILYKINEINEIKEKKGYTFVQRLLRKVINLLRSVMRESDRFGRLPDGLILALLTQTGGADAETAAKRIKSCIESHPFRTNGKPLKLNLIYAIAYCTPDMNNELLLVEKAQNILTTESKKI